MTVTFQLFAKAPVAGRVKTRLVPFLSAADAARLHQRMVERAAAAVAGALERIAGARGQLWCAPDAADPTLARIARDHGLALFEQASGDLGDRMRDALGRGLPGRVVLLGSDIPALDASRLVAAATALDTFDAVVNPSDDGGYVLIGCRDRVPECFDTIDWSTPAVMEQTRRRLDSDAGAGERAIRWMELPPLWDVDTAADVRRLAAHPSLGALLSGLKTGGTVPLVLNESQPV